LKGNASVLHRYSTVTEEFQHRINARVAAYELCPPDDLVAALGGAPTPGKDPHAWNHALHAYAEARLAVGPDADLSDPAVLAAVGWRDAAGQFPDLGEPTVERVPVLRAI
jgi:hypothetical protein